MALRMADRVRETATTTGTGSFTLGGAPTGLRTFLSAIGNGNKTFYTIIHRTAAEWEIGYGTVTTSGPTLSRDAVFTNSAGTQAAINFSAGTKDVICTPPVAALGGFTQRYDVRAFGATLDGSTDDTAAIDRAKAAAQAAGGSVYIHIGTAIYSGSLSGCCVEGYMFGLSILKRKSGTSNNTIIDLTAGNLFVKNLTIDGNYAGNTGTTAGDIALSTNCYMEACETRNTPYMAVQAIGENINIRNNIFVGPSSATVGALYAIWALDSSFGGPYRGMRIENNFFTGQRTGCVFLDCDGAVISGNTMVSCHWQTSPTGGGMIAVRSVGKAPVVVGNSIINITSGSDGSLASAVELDAFGAVVTGNDIDGCYYGVVAQAGSYITINANRINNSLHKAVEIQSGDSDCIVTNNQLRGTNNVVNDLGTNTLVWANQPGEAWKTYTPTVTAQTGSITSYTAAGSYRKIGKTVFFRFHVVITNNGTGGTTGGGIKVSLPVAAVDTNWAFAGRANCVSSKLLAAALFPDASTVYVSNYDGTYPGATSECLDISGVYESA